MAASLLLVQCCCRLPLRYLTVASHPSRRRFKLAVFHANPAEAATAGYSQRPVSSMCKLCEGQQMLWRRRRPGRERPTLTHLQVHIVRLGGRQAEGDC
jgi:hypothetical protein